MSISQNFPSSRPSLNLNFARSKKLDPRITFTRTSTATYVDEDGLVKSVATDTPRFEHNPSTGESLGLLIEESRTNLVTYSEQFDNAAWTKSNAGITTNTSATTAPDGNTTAEKLVENTASSVTHFALQTISVTSGATYTFSVFVKAAERTFAQVGLLNASSPFDNLIAYINLSSGSINSSTFGTVSGTSVSSVSYPNGWYRVILTGVVGSTTSLQPVIWTATSGAVSDAARTYTGDGTSGIYIWGAQLEAGAFPTSYIPTLASTVTRSTDNASITGTNFSGFYNPSEGTMFVNTRILGYSSSGFPRPFGFVEFADQFNDFWQVVYNNSSGLIFTETRVNGASPLAVTNFSLAANTNVKIANAIKNGEGQFTSFNGQSIVSNASSSLSSAINSIIFNYSNHNGIISQLIYYPVRLPNAQLQNLTK